MNAEAQDLKVKTIALAERVDAFATKCLDEQKAHADNTRVLLFAQVVRMLRTFEAVLTLVRAELNDGAGAVLRCLLEQYWVFHAIDKNPALLERARAEIDAESHKALSGLKRMDASDRADELTEEVLSEALKEFEKGAGFNAFDWAAANGAENTYLSLYRLLNAYAHGSLGALDKYVVLSEDGIAQQVRSRVAHVESIEFLLCGVSMLLESVAAFDQQPHTEARNAQRAFLLYEQGVLYQRFWELPQVAMAAEIGMSPSA